MSVGVTTAATPTTWWRPLSRADCLALLVMTALPVLLFGVPAALGHPAIAGDNLLQNFPLRVLSGRQLASGHLPLMNPLADSGTPLLGGMNAGSLFPLTLVFAFLPAILAWVINLVAVYVAAALGLFWLARYHGFGTAGALAGALSYAYLGAMNGQMVHLGVIQGYAMLPWEILAMLVLAQRVGALTSWRREWHGLLRPVLGLAVLWGLTALSGEPRAIGEMQLVVLVVGAVIVLMPGRWRPHTWSQRGVFVAGVSLGVLWGALIGLVQLITGWSYINVSQRTNLGYQFFGSGSLSVRWSALWFVPDLFGGNGILHQPPYFASYNLPEVTGYAGIVALVAVAAYLAQLLGRRRREVADMHLYGVLAVVGVWATWGDYTPLGRIFWSIPLFSSTRLQSRNVILVDLAASILLAWWLQRVGERRDEEASLLGWRRVVTLSPLAVVIAVAGLALLDGRAFVASLGLSHAATRWVSYERPTLVVHLALAVGLVLALVVLRARRARAVLTILVVDALVFFAFNATGLAVGRTNPMPSRTQAISHLGLTGRFAMVDPTGNAGDTFESMGLPNLNVFTQLPSIQGYGSLIDAYYGSETGTHPLFRLDACNLVRGQFRQLRLASLVLASNQLTSGPHVLSPQYCVAPHSQSTTFRYFGEVWHVSRLRLSGVDGAPMSASSFTVQLLDSTGKPIGTPIVGQGGREVTMALPGALAAAGIVIHARDGLRVGSSLVTLTTGSTYQLTTTFQQAVATRSWRLRETSGGLAFFRATSVLPSAWVSSLATGQVSSIRNALWGDTWVRVHATAPTTLLRSMTWIPGWRASAQRVGSAHVTTLRVRRSELIQAVDVGPGDWIIHFYYHAPHLELGLLGSGVGVLGLVGVFIVERRRERRRVEP